MRASTPAGEMATRRSFSKISLGTPTVSCLYGMPEGKNRITESSRVWRGTYYEVFVSNVKVQKVSPAPAEQPSLKLINIII